MLSTLKGLTKDQLRKRIMSWILYGLVALVIVLTVVALVNTVRSYFMAKQVEIMRTKMDAMEEANKSLADSVNNIRQLRELDSQVLSQLTDELSTQLRRDSALRTKIEILEATNESARNYLSAPIHPDVARLLENDQDGTSGVGASHQPPDEVPGGEGAKVHR